MAFSVGSMSTSDGAILFHIASQTKDPRRKVRTADHLHIVTAAWGTKPDMHSGGGKHDFYSGWSNTEKGSKRERNNEDQDSGRNGKENNEERRRTIQSNLKQPFDEGQCECWEASKHEKQCSGMKPLDAHGGYLSIARVVRF